MAKLTGLWRILASKPTNLSFDERLRNVQGIQQNQYIAQEYDVFLSYHRSDMPLVREIGRQLKSHGVRPWLDIWELRPGLPWTRILEEQISRIKSAAVFVGEAGIGPWQRQELDAYLREFVHRNCPVIPVLLENVPQEPVLPVFLQSMTYVDFRVQDPDPMQSLLWGIMGQYRGG